MAQRTNALNHKGDTVKVGTTGTISSLMTRELESIKHSDQTCTPTQRKQQTAPVSIPCGANPRKALQKRNQINEQGSSNNYNGGGSSTGHTNCARNIEGQKLRHAPRKTGHKIPMLVSDGSPMDQTLNACKAEKKAHSYIVEVVDLKCSNPMSTRLKKLGFSKLSESIS
ncbi:uncharacterized protein LOC141830435 [Curcuma longa]|uniref:uncharacterized protein LOC141830435 n=1 Tax=Curcuma longa TaxID=136217 RepID=UPI003D9F65D3